MTEMVLYTNTLPEPLMKLIRSEKVRVREAGGEVRLIPIRDQPDCTVGLRGILADYPEMSVDQFLERKHADKELEQ